MIAEYVFTDVALQSHAGPSFIYAITQAGLETWTLRPSLSLGRWLKEPAIRSVTPILIGLQPLKYLKHIAVAGETVILLSKYPLNSILWPPQYSSICATALNIYCTFTSKDMEQYFSSKSKPKCTILLALLSIH